METILRVIIFAATSGFFVYTLIGHTSRTVNMIGGFVLILGLYFSFTNWTKIKQVFGRRQP